MTPSATTVATALADRCPWEPTTEERLDRAVAFLGWGVAPTTVQQAGEMAALLVALSCWTAGALTVGFGTSVALAGAILGGLAAGATRYGPQLLATARRTRALGAAPGLVSRAVLRMRLSPAPETAATFAAESGQGRLAASLASHVRRATGRGRSGMQSFADEWAAWFPSLRRALTLVESAGSARPEERTRALDSALAVTLEGTRETMAEFAGSARGPATAIYAFGVLLPLALVAMVPAAGTIGIAVSLAPVVAVYDICLPLALLVASAWLLSRRPVAFPPARVSRRHPDVPDRRWPPAAAGLGAGAVAWLVSTRVAPAWTGLVASPGAAVGVGLLVHYRPMRAVRRDVRAIEAGLADALYLVGREVQRGRAVERAMDEAAASVDNAAGNLLADATRQQRQLRVGVRESLLGEYGVLRTVPSERARSTAELLSLAASEGRPAGQAIVAMADHVDDLQSVERAARRDLQHVTSTLAHTASVFGPLVGGATVTLADRMAVDGPLAAETTVPPSGLGLAVGAYVLVLAAILTVLATGLERGLDRSLVGYRVGRALLVATGTFVVAVAASRLLV